MYGMVLMRKVPHCHRHLNAWLPADGTLLGGLGSMISLEKVCYSRQVSKNLAISSFFSPCFMLAVSNVSSPLPAPGTMLAASWDGDRIISL